MEDRDEKKVEEVFEALKRHFPDTDIVRDRQPSRMLSCFYIPIDIRTLHILKITDECIMDNSLSSILHQVLGGCLEAMNENHNCEVVLFKDFHIEVGEQNQ